MSRANGNQTLRRCARERRRRRVSNNPTSALTWESQRAIWNGVCMCIQQILSSLLDPLGPHFFAPLPNADVPPGVAVVTIPYTPATRHPRWPHYRRIRIPFQQDKSPLTSQFGVVCRIGERQRGLSCFWRCAKQAPGSVPSERRRMLTSAPTFPKEMIQYRIQHEKDFQMFYRPFPVHSAHCHIIAV